MLRAWVRHAAASWALCLLVLWLLALVEGAPFLVGAEGSMTTAAVIIGTMAGLSGVFVAQAGRILRAGAFMTRTGAGMETFSREGSPGCFWAVISSLFLGAAFLFLAAVALLSGHRELLAWLP